MLQQSTPESKLSDSQWLDSLMREFKRKGKGIKVVPGCEFSSRPARIEPDPVIAELRRMARDRYTARYAAMCVGIKVTQACKIARENGFLFRYQARIE
jgi:hypothetical protein